MKEQNNIVRVGLYGIPGAGKSTTCSIIEAYCIEKGYKFTRIKLADPLYKAQEAIYTMAGQKLGDFYEQDGELLNFLGYYFRKINPNSLLDRFAETLAEKIDELVLHNLPISIIVCDDMRRPDAEFLRRNNFLN